MASLPPALNRSGNVNLPSIALKRNWTGWASDHEQSWPRGHKSGPPPARVNGPENRKALTVQSNLTTAMPPRANGLIGAAAHRPSAESIQRRINAQQAAREARRKDPSALGWKHHFNCQHCGERFGTSTTLSRYCSRDCKLAAAKKRHGQRRALFEDNCRHCGTSFDLNRSDSRYCSPRCRQAAYRARLKQNACANGSPTRNEPAHECAPTVTALAAAVGVSRRTMQMAFSVRRSAPEAISDAIERGQITLSDAYDVRLLPHGQQLAALQLVTLGKCRKLRHAVRRCHGENDQ
jgi:hypothetical protein